MIEEDFIMQGPLYMTQKAWIHPENIKHRNKPMNVLWTSPVNPETGESEWMEWCRRERFRLDFYENQRWHIVPKEDCKILTLLPDSEELRKYTMENDNLCCRQQLNFEAIANDYDALYIPEATRLKHAWDMLDGWDVATCIFLAPKYTVMDDETYALYKAGKINPEEKSYSVNYDPEVNLLPHALPPFNFKQPVDNSVQNAIDELREIANKLPKRAASSREKAEKYKEVADILDSGLAQNQGFETLCDKFGHYEHFEEPGIAEVLLKHGMNPNLKIKIFDRPYPISEVVYKSDSLKVFLQYGLDANVAMKTVLSYNGDTRALRLCLAAGADPNLADSDGVVPLMLAYKPEHVEWLLATGANPLAVDKQGRSIKEHQEKQPIYNFRVINCKMLDLATQKLYIHDKVSDLRKTLDVRDDKNIAVRKKLQPKQRKVLRWEEKKQAEKSL